MTKEKILELLAEQPFVLITMQEYLTAFPGYCLTKDQTDFQREVFRAGGPSHNPNGKDRSSQLHTFCHDNKLSFKLGANRVMFSRVPLADIGPYVNQEVKAQWEELDRELREEMKRCGASYSKPGNDSPPVQNNRPPQ